MKFFSAVFLLFFSIVVGAHEGHDQNPNMLKAVHGGVVKAGKEINLEYVVAGNEVKLYPTTHDGKPAESSKIKLTVTLKPAKAKKPTLAETQIVDNAYSFKVDLKGTHRIEVGVSVEFNGKKDNFKFQVEK